MKPLIAILSLLFISACSKDNLPEPAAVPPAPIPICVTVITYVRGQEVKRVTADWYENQQPGTDTVWCGEEMLVTMFHQCKK